MSIYHQVHSHFLERFPQLFWKNGHHSPGFKNVLLHRIAICERNIKIVIRRKSIFKLVGLLLLYYTVQY